MAKFSGFSKETVKFFESLTKNNNSEWFDAHRNDYERFVKKPSQDFVSSMGELLTVLDSGIQAIPKVNQSMFRINRDTRFSNDKSPYKTNMGLWFWSGHRPRMECSGFYLHLEGDTLMLGTGIYMFSKELLDRYRDAVVDPKLGKELAAAIKALSKNGYETGGKHYKKTPRGYDPSHPNAQLLLFNGIYAGIEEKIPAEFYSSKLLDYCFIHYKKMLPLHEWLKNALK